MKIVVVGGHFSPALSVIESLIGGNEIFYIGRKTSFEGDKGLSLEFNQIQSLGIKFFPISAARIQRKFTRFTLLSFSKFPVGLTQSYKILKKLKPDVVLAFGGYLSIPVCISAKLLNIPIVIHEQTLDAGFANKFISKFANRVLISWETSRKFYPKDKTVLTGLPLTKEVINAKKENVINNDLPTIYVTGGSSGSHFVNERVVNNLNNLLENFYIIHQTGDSSRFNDYDLCFRKKQVLSKNLQNRYIVEKFFDSKTSAKNIKNADLVIGRAGINTVSELIFFEKPAILIPLPFGQKNEQLNNANFLKALGLAEVLTQTTLTNDIFLENINKVVKNSKSYKLKKRILIDNAQEKIIKILQDVSKEKTA